MQVTSCRINYVQPREGQNNKLKAYVKISLDNQLAVTNIKFIDNGNKRYLVFPERKVDKVATGGEFVTIPLVNPLTSELRNHINEVVFDTYDNDPYNPEGQHQVEE